MMLSQADHARIDAAIVEAEARTVGELSCVVTGEVSQYREVPLAYAAAAALILPPTLLVFGLQPWTLIDRYLPASGDVGWSIGGGAVATQTVVSGVLGAYALAQAALFALVALIVSIPAVRRPLTPRFLVRHRVRRMAYGHFASSGLAHAPGRTGILIFASLQDRQVELVAEKAIHDAVGDEVWNAAVAALVHGMKRRTPAEGFLDAIKLCGDALAEHFPANGPHQHRSPDELVEI
jgi:putative membrane protein